MTTQKIKSGRITSVVADDWVGPSGTIFYNETIGDLRLGDGVTPGGIPILGAGSVTTVLYNNVAPTPIPNGVLWYNPDTAVLSVASNGSWVPISGVNDLNSLGDVNIATPNIGDTLIFNGVSWNNTPLNLTGGTKNQVLVKQSTGDYNYAWEDMIIDPAYTKLIDDTVAGIMYLGEAIPDSLESNPVWRIKRIDFDNAGNVDAVRYADGGLFDQIWNDRVSLTYI